MTEYMLLRLALAAVSVGATALLMGTVALARRAWRRA